MRKGLPIVLLLSLSGLSHAAQKVYTGPDCSADTDGRILTGLDVSIDPVQPEERKKYSNQFYGKDTVVKITRLSSEKISKDEAKRLMYRFAKRHLMDGKADEMELKKGGALYGMYLDEDLYRQYYLIESNKGFKAIGTFYSAYDYKYHFKNITGWEACAADLEDVYIISEVIDGHTADFATR